MAGDLTSALRSSDDSAWRTLRSVVVGQGVDVESTRLAFSSQEGDDSEFGILLTESDDVFEFTVRPSTGELLEWVNLTDWWRDSPYRSDIEACQRQRDGG